MTRWNGMRALALVAVAVLTGGCEWPPPDTVQTGTRGLAMEWNANREVWNDSVQAIQARAPQIATPPSQALDPAPAGTYQNVQVLGHLSEVEFTITMNAIQQWVAPNEGCQYCHVYNDDGSINYASDDIYTKVVAREMLKMVQDINTNWTSHVNEERGVNCWTCHQGQPVPTNFWFYTDRDQPLRHYLDREDLRVQSDYAIAGTGPANRSSIDQTMYVYTLMSDISNSLGVNCTFCHNTGRFAVWEESSPQRLTALRGLQMIRNANMSHMVALQDAWPENRVGPMGDGPKLSCSTCHQGANMPQYSNPASYGQAWNAFNQIGVPHPTVAADPDAGQQ